MKLESYDWSGAAQIKHTSLKPIGVPTVQYGLRCHTFSSARPGTGARNQTSGNCAPQVSAAAKSLAAATKLPSGTNPGKIQHCDLGDLGDLGDC